MIIDAFEQVRGGPDHETSPLLTEQCHRQDKPIIVTSMGNTMSVFLRSDWYFRGKGFLASFATLPQGTYQVHDPS